MASFGHHSKGEARICCSPCPDLMGSIHCRGHADAEKAACALCTHKAPADRDPGSTWITINRAFGSGSDSTLAVIQDQFRSGGDSGRSPTVD